LNISFGVVTGMFVALIIVNALGWCYWKRGEELIGIINLNLEAST